MSFSLSMNSVVSLSRLLSRGAIPILQPGAAPPGGRSRWLGPKVNQRAHGDLGGLHGSGRGCRPGRRVGGWGRGSQVSQQERRQAGAHRAHVRCLELLAAGTDSSRWPRGP